MLDRVKLVLGLCVFFFVTELARGESLTFSEINLNWFGRGGTEPRSQTIRKFLRDQGLMSDVMAFEEIVDRARLERDVLGGDYTCHSYQRSAANHQYVVICHKKMFKLEIAPGAASYALESVDVTGHLRPAVHGILTTASGRPLLHVFAVHLKAMPESGAVRLSQIGKIAAYLDAGPTREPVVLLGDFNTFAEDPSTFDRALAVVDLRQVDLPEPYSWASTTEHFDPAKFDRVWVSTALTAAVSHARIVGPCSSGDDTLIGPYNNDVSDHCAVTLTVDIGDGAAQ